MSKIALLINSLTGDGAERVISTLYVNHPSQISTELVLFHNRLDYDVDRENLVILNQSKSTIYKKKFTLFIQNCIIGMHYCKYIRNTKPSVSVSFLELPNFANMLACLFTNTKCIVSLRNNPHYCVTRAGLYLMRMSIKLSRYLSETIIVNSSDIKDILINKYHIPSKKVCCIYNPKDITMIEYKKNEFFNDIFFQTDDFILLNVARLDYQKGYHHLLRVFAELRKRHPCRLAICGKGPLERELKSLSKSLMIEDSVAFLGWQSNVYKYMNAADIFVMSSLAEGQPNALIEALICGCPCVSVDCDYGPREILENGKYGLLSKKITKSVQDSVHDPLTDEEQDLYDKLELMITNKGLREEFKQKSVEVYDKFDEKMIVKKYFDTFLEGVQDE